MSRLLTIRQACSRLGGISSKTFKRMVDAGEFPRPLRRNARWLRVPEKDVEDYLTKLDQSRQLQPV